MEKHTLPVHDFNKDDEESIPFKLIPLERKSQYDTSVPHRHNYYEVFFFLNGSGSHFIDFQEFEISTNSIHFVSPGQVHMVNRGLNSYGYVILFSREFYYSNLKNSDVLFQLPFLNNNTPRPILDLSEADFELFLNTVKEIERECKNSDSGPFREELLRSYLNILLINSKRFFEKQGLAVALQNGSSPIYQRFRFLLENNFTKALKPADYAGLLAITEKQLNNAVKSVTGKTTSEVIHERLVLEIKRLLLYSDLHFKEIAYFLSFEDPSYFARFFKKKTGKTLSEFRKESRGE